MTKTDHPIFGEFKAFEGEVPSQFVYDFVGSLTNTKFNLEQPASQVEPVVVAAPVPFLSEEYFEWISLLQAAKFAKDSFTVVELGAGFGRWAARAALAARQRGITDIQAILVEAEPLHAQWAREHMANNKIANFRVIEAAIGAEPGRQLFLIRQPGETNAQPREWYGQAANWTSEALHTATAESYYGHIIVDNGTGWGGIHVEVKTLADVLDGTGVVDLLDMDVQGAEADVVESGIDTLNQRVRLIHIGTHSTELEQRVRTVFTDAGWTNVWDFPLQCEIETPFGLVSFDDGVQTWKNPRLAQT